MSKRGKKNNKRNVIKKGEKRDRDAKVLVEGEGGDKSLFKLLERNFFVAELNHGTE